MNYFRQPIQKELRRFSKPSIWILLPCAAALFVFIITCFSLHRRELLPMDLWMTSQLHSFISPRLTSGMLFFTFFGNFKFLVPAFIILVLFCLNRNLKSAALYIAGMAISSTGVLYLLKFIFRRPRPENPLVHAVSGFSFPSGHVFSGFIFFGLLIYMVWKSKINRYLRGLIIFLLAVFVTVIAFSRVYLRVHYASDLLGGFCLALVWLTLSFWIYQAGSLRKLQGQHLT